MQRIIRYLFLSFAVVVLFPFNGRAIDQWSFLGCGFANLNSQSAGGCMERGEKYVSFQATYFFEFLQWEYLPFARDFFAASVSRPESGLRGGFDMLLRRAPSDRGRSGPFLPVGAGTGYKSIGFKEQGAHLLGILGDGLDSRYEAYVIEDRFSRYSDGNSAWPNRPVNTNVLCVGVHF
jgi:hypothetical protein